MNKPQIYFYKMTTDNGGAPFVTENLLSLAICKPMIRSTAIQGSIIFGFGARSTIGERLVYIAEVTDKLFSGEYYDRGKYKSRKDCIYYRQDDLLLWRPGSIYHHDGSGTSQDVGKPPHTKAKVLLSTKFRYLGNKGTENYKEKYPEIANAVFKLAQGHRVNHSKEIVEELLRLKKELWKQYPNKKIIGSQIESDTSGNCGECEGNIVLLNCQ